MLHNVEKDKLPAIIKVKTEDRATGPAKWQKPIADFKNIKPAFRISEGGFL